MNLEKKLLVLQRIVGTTKDDSLITTWDYENQVCNLTVDGEVFFGGTECIADIDNGKIVNFEIVGIGLSK